MFAEPGRVERPPRELCVIVLEGSPGLSEKQMLETQLPTIQSSRCWQQRRAGPWEGSPAAWAWGSPHPHLPAHAGAAHVAAFPPKPGPRQACPGSGAPEPRLRGPSSPRGWACPGGSPRAHAAAGQGQDAPWWGPSTGLRPLRRGVQATGSGCQRPTPRGGISPPPGHHGRFWTLLPLGKGSCQPGPSCAGKGPAESVTALEPAAGSQLPSPWVKSTSETRGPPRILAAAGCPGAGTGAGPLCPHGGRSGSESLGPPCPAPPFPAPGRRCHGDCALGPILRPRGAWFLIPGVGC